MSTITFLQLVKDSVHYLERNYTCPKHHVSHTGSVAYLLDFYDYLGEVEKGKKLVDDLLNLIVESPTGGKVFYPGHLNPMNMSQNVIDTGTAVDTIARFARRNTEVFSAKEHQRIQTALAEVVESYLTGAASSKKITNQRLWGLTGLASFGRYAKETGKFKDVAGKSIRQAFIDATPDGFFRYFPNPEKHSLPYDGITTFYQSRHTAFIHYALQELGMDNAQYQEDIERSVSALLSMYGSSGIKDLRMECKRWYWLGSYEVASHPFDAFALAQSSQPVARLALHNVLYQIKKHFYDGFMHSHTGINLDFQCPIFWTAHLAWLTRIEGIEKMFDGIREPVPFEFLFKGKEAFTKTSKDSNRILVNARWQERNPTEGILTNGLKGKCVWSFKIPRLPHAYFFSVREVLNHSWYALRGGRLLEAIVRLVRFAWLSFHGILPRYCVSSGKIEALNYSENELIVGVVLASKFGTLSKKRQNIVIKF